MTLYDKVQMHLRQANTLRLLNGKEPRTIADLAAEMGLTKQAVYQQLHADSNSLTLRTIRRLGKALGVGWDFFEDVE